MSTAIDVESTAVVVRERSSVLLAPVMDVNTALARLAEFQQFCANYLQESKDGGLDGGDFGAIPGAGKKKVLLKSGADKLCEVYGLYDEYVVISSVENWETGLFDYTLKCVLKSRRDDSMVGAGVGSCSSFESKYRWREAKRKCPACGKETIIKGKAEYGGGFICWKKDGRSDGCGAKFKDGDKSIEDQIQGRVENPDIIDSKNTVLKMAKKRAKIDAVIGVTRSSGIFTQDLDDLPPVPPTPTKPPVETTTEDIPLSAKGAASTPVAAAIIAANSSKRTGVDAPSREEYEAACSAPILDLKPSSAVELCGKAENSSYFGNIRKALPEPLKARNEEFGRQYLKHIGCTKKDGTGSLQNVEKILFGEIMRDALVYIAEVAKTVNG